jgi:hypothetical protein
MDCSNRPSIFSGKKTPRHMRSFDELPFEAHLL